MSGMREYRGQDRADAELAQAIERGNVVFNNDKKFDFQLAQGRLEEHKLVGVLLNGKFELKGERHQPWATGNICIETSWNGKPSGLATTEADVWAHQLIYGEETICTLLFPVAQLRRIARFYENDPHRDNRFHNGGDGGLSSGVLIPIGPLRHWRPG